MPTLQMLLITAPAFAQAGGAYLITRSTVDGGGSTSLTGGSYSLGGTVGQPDAATLSSGTYSLTGGFWSGPSAIALPSPQTGDDVCVGGTNNGNPCTQASDCPGGACRLKNRFISATLPTTAAAHGLKVNLVSLDANSVATPGDYVGTDRWLGPPTMNINDGISPAFNAARAQCPFTSQDWTGVGLIHVFGDVVVPLSSYELSICSSASGPCSTPLRVDTAKFGDIVPPVNTTNFQDVNSIVAKFQGTPAGPSKTRTKLTGSIVNPTTAVNFQEVSAAVAAFQGKPFKMIVTTPPEVCP